MENLVGRKVKYIYDNEFMWFGRKESYEIEHQDSTHFYLINDNGFRNAIENNCLDTHFELLPKETQFKQGDKVLWTDNLEFWHEGIFLTKYNDSYIIESDEMLLYAIEIKPYEDEIKVGDWVKHNDFITKYTKEMAGHWTKITNPELIKLLNEE